MTSETISYLSRKYNVASETIALLGRVASTWSHFDLVGNQKAAASAMRIYSQIVRNRCAGVDPLV